MPKFLFKAIKVNEYLFPVFVGLAFIALILETYSYIGFLRKFFFVDSRFFLMAALVSAFLLKQANIKKSVIPFRLSILVFRMNRIILPVPLIVYFVMQIFESIRYPNYIFSTFHLQPGNFLYLIILSGGLYVLDKFKVRIINLNNFLMFGIFSISVFMFVENFGPTVHQAIASDLYIMLHPYATYDQKMQNYWGFFYGYMVFVKANTPANSTIIIPPQTSPWLSTGNIALVKYFLYPRNLMQGTLEAPLNAKSADYVMLAWGEWADPDASKYGWPREKVDAEKIVYFNEDKHWGIIKVKKQKW